MNSGRQQGTLRRRRVFFPSGWDIVFYGGGGRHFLFTINQSGKASSGCAAVVAKERTSTEGKIKKEKKIRDSNCRYRILKLFSCELLCSVCCSSHGSLAILLFVPTHTAGLSPNNLPFFRAFACVCVLLSISAKWTKVRNLQDTRKEGVCIWRSPFSSIEQRQAQKGPKTGLPVHVERALCPSARLQSRTRALVCVIFILKHRIEFIFILLQFFSLLASSRFKNNTSSKLRREFECPSPPSSPSHRIRVWFCSD